MHELTDFSHQYLKLFELVTFGRKSFLDFYLVNNRFKNLRPMPQKLMFFF